MRGRPSPALLVALAALVVAAAGTAWGRIPAGDGLIRACSADVPGQRVLSVLEEGEACGPGQLPVSWAASSGATGLARDLSAPVTLRGPEARVLRQPLAAGTYAVTVRLQVGGLDFRLRPAAAFGDAFGVECRLAAGSGGPAADRATGTLGISASGPGEDQVVLTGLVRLAQAVDSADVLCALRPPRGVARASARVASARMVVVRLAGDLVPPAA